jgi:hypothetical protein
MRCDSVRGSPSDASRSDASNAGSAMAPLAGLLERSLRFLCVLVSTPLSESVSSYESLLTLG